MGREPIFQISSNNPAMVQNAHNMEVKLNMTVIIIDLQNILAVLHGSDGLWIRGAEN